MLRIAGVRQADLKGYSFSREDVNARALANAYAQTLGQVFTHEMKPYEVEILVAQVGASPAEDELFHILYDGTVMDEEGATVLGGQADTVAEALASQYRPDLGRDDAIRLGASVLAGADGRDAHRGASSRSRCSTGRRSAARSAACGAADARSDARRAHKGQGRCEVLNPTGVGRG